MEIRLILAILRYFCRLFSVIFRGGTARMKMHDRLLAVAVDGELRQVLLVMITFQSIQFRWDIDGHSTLLQKRLFLCQSGNLLPTSTYSNGPISRVNKRLICLIPIARFFLRIVRDGVAPARGWDFLYGTLLMRPRKTCGGFCILVFSFYFYVLFWKIFRFQINVSFWNLKKNELKKCSNL